LKDKNELSKTFSQWLTITKYHPSTIIRADTIFCSSHEKFEDTKGAIRNRISKNRQHSGQKKKHKRTNNDRENIHIKLKIE
jgi:adenylate cyclase class IV